MTYMESILTFFFFILDFLFMMALAAMVITMLGIFTLGGISIIKTLWKDF